MKVYLSGPVNGCTDDEAKGWREQAKEWLPDCEVFDPMIRDYRGRELEPGITQEIVEGDKGDIRGIDVNLRMYDKPSEGSAQEWLFSWDQGKRNVLVDITGRPLSPWAKYHAHHIFQALREACAFINAMAKERAA